MAAGQPPPVLGAITLAWRVRAVNANQAADGAAPSFNVFRNRERADLCCAVPESEAVPSFLTAASWEFAGRTVEGATPRGFDPRPAAEGAARNGFYLFQEVR